MSDPWAIVRTVGTDEEAELIAGYLRACDVPAEVLPLPRHQLPVTFGRLGEVRVRVPEERRAEAEKLLAERDARPRAPIEAVESPFED
jgi:hypothetical protein